MLKEVQLAVASFTSSTAQMLPPPPPPPNMAEMAGNIGKNVAEEKGNGISGFPFSNIPSTFPGSISSSSSLVMTTVPDSLPQVFNFVEHYVGRSIRFCKRFPAFSVLKQVDQMIILKDAFPAIFAVYHAFSYVREKDGFPLAIGVSVKCAFLRLQKTCNIVAFYIRDKNVFYL